jgi:hypothetical protein
MTVNKGIKLIEPPIFSVNSKANGIEIERAKRLFFKISSKLNILANSQLLKIPTSIDTLELTIKTKKYCLTIAL